MKIRSFIAINLPEEIKSYLANFIRKIKRKNKADFIKWVEEKNLHLTLHFLGNLEKRQLEQIDQILSFVVSKYRSFNLEIKEIDAFPNLSQPKVLYIKCQERNKDSLKKLREEIGEGIKKIGLKIDKRSWQPHVTIARVKKSIKLKIEGLKLPNLIFKVESIELMRSDLQKDGPVYSIISSYNLLK